MAGESSANRSDGSAAGGVVWHPEPRPWGRADALALAVWTAALAAFFWDLVSFQKALFYFDITEINFPYRKFFADELRAGRFARWCPGLYCGHPLYSESQAGYLHPLKYLLYPWLPAWQAFGLDTVLSIWLTGVGTYLWLRRHVGAAGALAGAAVFGLSGFVWAHLIHTSMINALPSVPFAVWALEAAWDGGRPRGVALGALALAVQVFAGHLQDTILTAGLIAAYGLYRAATGRGGGAGARSRRGPGDGGRDDRPGPDPGRRAVGPLQGAARPLAAGRRPDLGRADLRLVAPRAAPHAGGARGLRHPRPRHRLDGRLLPVPRDERLHGPDRPGPGLPRRGGLSRPLGRVLGAAGDRGRDPDARPVHPAVRLRPPAAGDRQLADPRAVPPLGVARRGGLGRGRGRPARPAGPGVAERRGPAGDRAGAGLDPDPGGGLLAGLGGARPLDDLVPRDAVSLARPRAGRRGGPDPGPGPPGRVAGAAGRGGDGPRRPGVGGGRAARRDPRRPARRPPRRRADDHAPVLDRPPPAARLIRADPAAQRLFGMVEKSSAEPGYASEPIDFLAVRDTLDWSLPIAWGLRSSRGETGFLPRRVVEFSDHVEIGAGRLEIQGVTHVVSPRPKLRLLGPPVRAGSAYLYAGTGARPRARLVGRPEYAAGEREAIAALDRLGAEVVDRLVVEDPDRPLAPGAAPAGTARIVRDEPETVAVAVDSGADAYLVLADTYDPGWSATVDGRPAPIRPAWVAYRAVFVPTGRHTVVFRYEPAGFRAGLLVTALGAVVALACLAWPRPVAAASDPHGDAGWPAAWPRALLIALALVLAASTVRFSLDGGPRVSLSRRWAGRSHQFTWGAGIEAMRRQPRMSGPSAPR